ncbi:helix-turn-helix domain-containing protein [Micromonospora craniellae]|uniref:helix-turn-helix domain-containing protein n=1 Tax=Micromonospora craniellae TaxID=2294034 RepID=UPI002695501A|nr:helix-turn-helix transcriptional regulator [Micromonospora craniellae]
MTLLRRVIGAVLRRQRQRQRRTLREVAEAAGVSVPYLSEVERGRKEASSEVLGAVSRALGLPLSDLLGEVRDELRRVERPAPTTPQGSYVPAVRGGDPTASVPRGTDGFAHPVAQFGGIGFGSTLVDAASLGSGLGGGSRGGAGTAAIGGFTQLGGEFGIGGTAAGSVVAGGVTAGPVGGFGFRGGLRVIVFGDATEVDAGDDVTSPDQARSATTGRHLQPLSS